MSSTFSTGSRSEVARHALYKSAFKLSNLCYSPQPCRGRLLHHLLQSRRKPVANPVRMRVPRTRPRQLSRNGSGGTGG